MAARNKHVPLQKNLKFGTQSQLKKPQPVRQFDVSYSDLPSHTSSTSTSTDDSGLNGFTEKENGSLIPKTVPSHLLMLSILEHLCLMYARDHDKSKRLFKVICEQLIHHKVVSPLTALDEMSSFRNQYRSFMDSVLKAGMVKVSDSLPLSQNKIELDLAVPRLSRHENYLITSEAIRQMQTSRYTNEFTELQRIGSGGFGSVYMAKHNLDGRKYAIKKIRFKHSQPEVWMKVLREVKALANVQHPNIVGYNAAWLEYATCLGKDKCGNAHGSDETLSMSADVSFQSKVSVTDDSVMFTDDFTDDEIHIRNFHETQKHGHRICVVKPLDESSTDDKCRACELLQAESDNVDSFHGGFVKRIPKHECSLNFNPSIQEAESHATRSLYMEETWESVEMSTFWDRRLVMKRSLSCDVDGKKKSPENSREDHCTDKPNAKFHVTLFIQMELCSLTMKDWLQQRNQRCSDQTEFVRYIDVNMKIFKQILKGVDFIHTAGLIHRDLKPRNIFLHEPELHVKIGDFGLAKGGLVKSKEENILLTPSPDVQDEFRWESHTSGVGTSTYAAPEQLEGSFYSNKSDIYSLGVILYELFHNFKTEMEKFHSLNNLRKEGKIDQEFEDNWPIQARFVRKMTHHDHHTRPTTKVLLSSELYLTKDQVILDMQKKLDEKETEIEKLKKCLLERDKIISNMKKDVEQVEMVTSQLKEADFNIKLL